MAAARASASTARIGNKARTGRSAQFVSAELLIHLSLVIVPRSLSVRDILARLPSVAMSARCGVPAAALTKLVLTILSLAGRTAPLWPCSR